MNRIKIYTQNVVTSSKLGAILTIFIFLLHFSTIDAVFELSVCHRFEKSNCHDSGWTYGQRNNFKQAFQYPNSLPSDISMNDHRSLSVALNEYKQMQINGDVGGLEAEKCLLQKKMITVWPLCKIVRRNKKLIKKIAIINQLLPEAQLVRVAQTLKEKQEAESKKRVKKERINELCSFLPLFVEQDVQAQPKEKESAYTFVEMSEQSHARLEELMDCWSERQVSGEYGTHYQARIDGVRGTRAPTIPMALCDHAHAMLQDFDIDQAGFTVVYDNEIQQVLQNEFITIVNGIAPLYKKYQHCAPINSLNRLTIESLDVGMQYNQQGNIAVASKVADFCWATLHLTTELSLGLGEGVIQGVKNTGHMVFNPVETVCNMVHGVGLLAKGLIEVIKFDCDVLYYQLSGQSELANARIDEMKARISAVASAIATQCRELSARDIGRGIGTFGTEMVLQQKLITAFGKFFKFTKTQMAQLAQEFAKDERLLLTTAEGVQVYVADGLAREIAQAQNLHLQDAQRALDKGKAAVKVVQAEGAATAGVKAAQAESKLGKAAAAAQKAARAEVVTLETAQAIWAESEELAQLSRRVEALKKSGISDARVGVLEDIIGMADSTKYMKALEKAEKFYTEIRYSLSKTIDIISHNTGVQKTSIEKILKHIFINEHPLRERIGLFDANLDMTAAFKRLIDRSFIQSDLLLLQHELSEALIMNKLAGTTYDSAHRLVQTMYDWHSYLNRK